MTKISIYSANCSFIIVLYVDAQVLAMGGNPSSPPHPVPCPCAWLKVMDGTVVNESEFDPGKRKKKSKLLF